MTAPTQTTPTQLPLNRHERRKSRAITPTHPREPQGIEISMSPEMVEKVMEEWEAENPGKRAHIDMGSDEFANRMMVKIKASARFIPDA